MQMVHILFIYIMSTFFSIGIDKEAEISGLAL